MLDFVELQVFPNMPSWATLLKYTPDQHFMEYLKNRVCMDLINIKVTFDLDFDLGSQKECHKWIPEVRFVRKDGIAHEYSFIVEKVMICLLLGFWRIARVPQNVQLGN